MDEVEEFVYEMNTKEQLAKMILATTAGFLATKLVETVFTNFVTNRQFNRRFETSRPLI